MAIYFSSLTLKKSKFVVVIHKPIVERFLASYILIFVKNYHIGLNNLRTPSFLKIGQKLVGYMQGLETRM